jgi:predicted nucleic acid-binding protein
VPRTVHDCPDHEDNLVLDLAAEVGAMLIVSNDTDLLSMCPWRGTPVLTRAAFAAKLGLRGPYVGLLTSQSLTWR